MDGVFYFTLQIAIAIVTFYYFFNSKLNFAVFGFNILLMTFITVLCFFLCFTDVGSRTADGEGFYVALYTLGIGVFSFASNYALEYIIKTKNIKKILIISFRIMYVIFLVSIIIFSFNSLFFDFFRIRAH